MPWHLQAQLDIVTLSKYSTEGINCESTDDHFAAQKHLLSSWVEVSMVWGLWPIEMRVYTV